MFGRLVDTGAIQSPDRVGEFASLVDFELAKYLVSDLGIVDNDEAIVRYVKNLLGDRLTDARLRQDQKNAEQIAKGLRLVLVERQPADDVYRDIELHNQMPLDQWRQQSADATMDYLRSLEMFANSSEVPEIEIVADNHRWAYLNAEIRQSLCGSRSNAKKPGSGSSGEAEYECSRKLNQRIDELVTEKVLLSDPSLERYVSRLRFYTDFASIRSLLDGGEQNRE